MRTQQPLDTVLFFDDWSHSGSQLQESMKDPPDTLHSDSEVLVVLSGLSLKAYNLITKTIKHPLQVYAAYRIDALTEIFPGQCRAMLQTLQQHELVDTDTTLDTSDYTLTVGQDKAPDNLPNVFICSKSVLDRLALQRRRLQRVLKRCRIPKADKEELRQTFLSQFDAIEQRADQLLPKVLRF